MASLQQVYKDGKGCAFASIQAQMYFDYPNQQLRIDQTENIYTYSFVETLWLDYAEQTLYYYDRDNEECYSDSLSGDLNYPEIPEDAYFNGDYIVGSQAIDIWIEEVNGTESVSALTRETCFPVSVSVNNATTGAAFLNQLFTNVLPDLPPYYFDIPAICTQDAKKRTGLVDQKLKIVVPFQN